MLEILLLSVVRFDFDVTWRSGKVGNEADWLREYFDINIG